ncbi:MAG TPA: hypothetical protein VG206_07190 [Terriglobia bacterium]|nr:hypothetical protein [Terriglobia bacterium]
MTNTRRKIKKDKDMESESVDRWLRHRECHAFLHRAATWLEEYDDHSRLGTTSAGGVGVLE